MGAQPFNNRDKTVHEGLDNRIRITIDEHARLPNDTETLDEQTDLYEAGMTSLASVSLMLALEDEFDIEFPDNMLRREIFDSIESIRDALRVVLRAEE